LAVPKRTAEFLGLRDIDVLPGISQETAADYFNIYECPEILTQGKSSFLIGGSPELKPGVDIKIELIKNDSNDVIYTQPVMGHSEGGLRRVSIEVYDDTPAGVYTLYLVGELNPERVNVPPEYQGIYNVRWSKRITVNVMGVNTQPILFYKQPSISVNEKFKEFVVVPSGSTSTTFFTGSGEPTPGFTNPEVPVQNATEGGFGEYTYPNIDFTNKAKLSIIEENKPLTKLSGKVGHIGSQGKQVKTMSPVVNDYIISLSGDSTISSLYVGQQFTLNNPQVDTSKFTMQDYYSLPAQYTSSVMKIINNKTFIPKDVFYINDNRTTPPTLIPAPFIETYPISASYLDLPSQTTSSINFFSFADITVADMKTFSGDVHKVKIYAKSEGSLGDFELIYDSPVESHQVLFDSQETTSQVNMGYFLDLNRINKYWELYDGDDGNTAGSLAYDSTYVNDAMKITGDNTLFNDSIRVQNKTAIDFQAGVLYNFRAKVYGIKKDKQQIDGTVSGSEASFKVMAYGDAFNKEETTSAHWGDEKLSIPDMPDAVSEYDFGMVEGSFLADNTATGYVQFKIDSGEWYVSDIELKTATDTAFNPDLVKVTAPVPPLLERPDRMRFLVEFYDVNNNIADSVIFSEPITFQGPNINISGTDNILSGSMFIGSALASGVEMAGVNSAFIRSMGYQGFKSGSGGGNNPTDGTHSGFLMFSGSVLPDSGDDYKGVGLELVGHSGSYLKFRTSPSELDIRTDAFFIGQESIQFMSGSDGNIEISSSLFHLDPVNDLLVIGADAVINADLTVNNIRTPATIGGSPSTHANASASITSEGNVVFRSGSIANWKIFGSKLSGSNATLDADGAALYMSTKGPNTDDDAAFDIQRDEYYIDFTPADQGNTTNYYVKFGPNFAVDSDGVLIASGAVFEGQITASTGQIGGADIGDTSLAYSPYWVISSSANTSDPVSFISSSRFKVSAGGTVTGSQVNFTGGRIANWDIIGDTLSSVNSSDKGIVIDADNSTPIITIKEDSNNKLELYHTTTSDWGIIGKSGGSNVFRLGSTNQIAGWDINSTYISKAISGSAAYQDFTRVYMSSVNDNTQNITEGFTVYRKDEDIDSGAVKVVRVGGLSDTTNLHANNDYGLQVIQKDSNNNYSNIMYIGSGSQEISGFSINPIAIHSSDKSLILSGSGEITGSQVKFTGGSIGGFHINANNFWGGNADIDSSATKIVFGAIQDGDTPKIALGNSANDITLAGGTGLYVDGDGDFKVGSTTKYLKYTVSGDSMEVKTGTFELDANNIEISSTNASMSLGEGKILLDGANSKISIGTGNKVTIQGGATDNFMTMGSKTSFTHFDQSTAGIIVGMDATVPKMELVGSATNYLSFDGSNFDIKLSEGLELDATNIELSSTQASMSLGEGKIKMVGASTSFIQIGAANSITLKDDGTDRFLAIGSKTSFTHFDQSTAGVILGTDSGTTKFELAGSGTNYLSFDGSNFDIKLSQGLELDATNIELSSTQASMSLGEGKIVMQGASTSTIKIGASNSITISNDGTDSFMTMGNKTSFSHYDKSTIGIILGMDTAVPKFEMAKSSDEYLRWDSTDGLDIRTKKMEVSASNLEISSTQASMSIGDPNSGGGAIVLHADGTDKMLKFGGKTTFDQTTTAGLIMGMDASNPEFDYTVGTGNNQYIRMTPAGIDIKTPSFNLDTDRLDISSDDSRIDVYDDSGGVDGSDLRVRIGEVDPTTANHYGIVVYDGTGSGSADELVHFSDVKNQIASWSISAEQISSENLVLDSSGTIQTGDFASGVQGWRITSANNGEAEFEKVTVRGTLATTVFEKESVNAVGGQLYVANSTIISQSAQLSATATTMSVANVGGFVANEIISAKKVSDTGFSTEYMLIESASRDNPSSEKDISGKLYVVRGYSGSQPGTNDTGSLGDAATSSTTYENGQVIVSTGKVGTGYIRLNANPNDTTTPYIDIVERTGSAIYDISLKARLGDLSGLSSGLLYGETNPGFGLFTENVFLQGAITATTGSFTGAVWINTDANNRMALGSNVDGGTNDGIYINSNNYWYTNDRFRIGDTNNYFEWDTSTLTIKPQTLEINAGSGDFKISSTHKSMSLGDGDILLHSKDSTTSMVRVGSTTTKAIYISGSNSLGVIRSGKTGVSDATEGFWIANNNSDAEFHVGDGTDYIKFDDNALTIETRAFELDANNGDLALSSTHKSMSLGDNRIKLVGQSSPYIQVGLSNSITIKTDGTDQFMVMGSKTSFSHEGTGTAGILIGMDSTNPQAEFVKDASNYFIFDDGVDIKTLKFELDASNLELSSTNASMSLGEGKLVLQGSSTPFITLNSGSSNDIKLKTDGTDAFITMGSKDSFSDEGKDTAGILIGMDSSNPQAEFVKNANNYFIFDDGVDIKTDTFQLDAGPGDLQISSTQKSMSLGDGGIELAYSASNQAYMKLGSTGGQGIEMTGSNYGGTIRSGKRNIDDSTSGFWLHNQAGTAQFHVGDTTDALKFNGSKFEITSSHMDVSGQDVSFDIENFELDASNLELSSTQASMSLGEGKIILQGASTSTIKVADKFIISSDGTDEFLAIGNKTSFTHFDQSTVGVIMGMDDSTSKFEIVGDSDNYFSFDGSSLDVKAETFGLKTSNMLVSSSLNNGTIRLGASQGPASVSANTQGIYMDGNGDFQVYGDADNYIRFDISDKLELKSENFELDTPGLDIVGTSGTAASNKITLGTTPNTSVAGTNAGIYMDGAGDFLIYGDADNFFRFDVSDQLKIGAETFDLKTPNLRVSSSLGGTIAMGSTVPKSISGSGVFLSGSGDFLAGSHTGNKIQYGAGAGSVIIQSSTFALNATTLIMDSATNNGKIALGSTPPTSAAYTSNAGIYMDGNGDFLVRADADNFIKFDQDASPKLLMKADTFYLGGSGQFVSGSVGNIEISSSNFHLQPDGDIEVKKVTAVAGSIGGFNINSTKLNSTSGNIEMDGGGGQIVLGAGLSSYPNSFIHLKANLSAADGNMLGIGNSVLDNCPFLVNGAGKMIATSALISGSSVILSTDELFLGLTGSAFISASNGNMQISSSGYELKPAGDATFAGGDITFEQGGDITSATYLIERSRLFGDGNDGDIQLLDDNCTVTGGEGSAGKTDDSNITDERNTTICTRSGGTWTMQGDWYTNSLHIDDKNGATTLDTNGFRLFVKQTLTIDASCVISNNGSDGQAGSGRTGNGNGGAGGTGGTLAPGTDGVFGGYGGLASSSSGTKADGKRGGGGGGTGGIVFISARYITNNGSIQSRGGSGGAGPDAGNAA